MTKNQFIFMTFCFLNCSMFGSNASVLETQDLSAQQICAKLALSHRRNKQNLLALALELQSANNNEKALLRQKHAFIEEIVSEVDEFYAEKSRAASRDDIDAQLKNSLIAESTFELN